MVAGDWNTRTGPAVENTRHILGRFALATRCDNCDRLVNFADVNRLVVTNTRFQHPRRNLVTWRSNDGSTSNQNDYIPVKARWASSVLDSRAYRGPDTGSAHRSEHTLVRASHRIRLQARKSTKIPKRINVTNLKLSTGKHFRLEFHNRFSLLQPRSDPQPETEWLALKSATVESAHTHLDVYISGLDHRGEPSASGKGEGITSYRSSELSWSTAPHNSLHPRWPKCALACLCWRDWACSVLWLLL